MPGNWKLRCIEFCIKLLLAMGGLGGRIKTDEAGTPHVFELEDLMSLATSSVQRSHRRVCYGLVLKCPPKLSMKGWVSIQCGAVGSPRGRP